MYQVPGTYKFVDSDTWVGSCYPGKKRDTFHQFRRNYSTLKKEDFDSYSII